MIKEDNKKYALKLLFKGGTEKYVLWCDEHWYDVTVDPTPRFTQAEVYKMANMMKDHYVYKMDVISETGAVDHLNFLWRARHKIARDDTPPQRKSIYKMVLKKPMFKPL